MSFVPNPEGLTWGHATPRGHMATTETSVVVMTGGCSWHGMGEARDAGQHPQQAPHQTMTRAAVSIPQCHASGPGLRQAPGWGGRCWGPEGSYHAHEAGVVQQARDVKAADPSCLWGRGKRWLGASGHRTVTLAPGTKR